VSGRVQASDSFAFIGVGSVSDLKHVPPMQYQFGLFHMIPQALFGQSRGVVGL